MRIICLEEHVLDTAISEATVAAFAREAPYAHAIAYQDNPARFGNQPGTQGLKVAMAEAAETLEARLAAMDANRIDMQVLSYTNLMQLVPKAQAADLARAANDRLAEAAIQHPHRFAGLSSLPWQDPDAAVREAERCARDLGLSGTMLSGHPCDDALIDDPRYEPVLATLQKLGTALYIHPGPPLLPVQQPYYGGLTPEVTGRLSLFGWGWHNEAGIQVIRLILSGMLDRHPRLNIISGHWGEMVPFFLQRMDDTMPPEATGLSRTVTQTYRDQVWVTSSGMLHLPHFRFVREVVGSERILFAVDYPYLTMTGTRAWLEALPIPEEERHAIAHRNAERLLRIAALDD